MTGDRAVRWTAVAAVLAVAAVAAVISYLHAVEVVTAHGEPGQVGRLYPALIDGLIVAASMVLLDSARHREHPPRLAWWMLAAGIAATLAANVLAGARSGGLGAVIAAWPALAFVGCYELLMMLVRASARRRTAAHSPGAFSDGVLPQVAMDAEAAAVCALRASLAAGNPLSARQLQARFALTRTAERKVRQRVLAEANGCQLTTASERR